MLGDKISHTEELRPSAPASLLLVDLGTRLFPSRLLPALKE